MRARPGADPLSEPRRWPLMAATSPLLPREIRSLGSRRLEDWRIKVYGLAPVGHPVRSRLVEAATRLSARVLPVPRNGSVHSGVGYVIVDDAPAGCAVSIAWWDTTGGLHLWRFSAPAEAPTRLVAEAGSLVASVWDLRVIDFESRAWTEVAVAAGGAPGRGQLDEYLRRVAGDS